MYILSNYLNENLMEIPTTLTEMTSHNNIKYQYRIEFEYLKKNIDNFLDDIDDERFLVLPGIRGVGKTTLLYQVYDYLLNKRKVPYDQILYVSCDDLNDMAKCSIRELTEIYLKNLHDTNIRMLKKKIFLLIDESQYDKNWALSGKIIYDRTINIFMIFTGSSALHLESNPDAARRSYSYEIRPVSYQQHIKLKYNIPPKTFALL
jgi:predicted AAA+ superfamily ATPase